MAKRPERGRDQDSQEPPPKRRKVQEEEEEEEEEAETPSRYNLRRKTASENSKEPTPSPAVSITKRTPSSSKNTRSSSKKKESPTKAPTVVLDQEQYTKEELVVPAPSSSFSESSSSSSDLPSSPNISLICPHIHGSFSLTPQIEKTFCNPSLWHCQDCGTTESAWACLTCGFVGCGRYHSSHALSHSKSHPDHCLVFDVLESFSFFCYECDSYFVNDTVNKDLETLRQWVYVSREDPVFDAEVASPPPVTETVPSGFTSLEKEEDLTRKRLIRTVSQKMLRPKDYDLEDLRSTEIQHWNSLVLNKVLYTWRRKAYERSLDSLSDQEDDQEDHQREPQPVSMIEDIPPSPKSPEKKEEETSNLAPTLQKADALFSPILSKSGFGSFFSSPSSFSLQNVSLVNSLPRRYNPPAEPSLASSLSKTPLLPPMSPIRPRKQALEACPFPPGKIGLRNLGNTCYMNSILQALSNIAELREYVICDLVPGASKSFRSFLMNPDRKAFPTPFGVPALERVNTLQCMQHVNRKPSALLKLEEISLAMEMHRLLRVMWSGQLSVVTPHALLGCIRKSLPQYRGFIQQDADEFLNSLLDKMNQELKDASKEKGSPGHPALPSNSSASSSSSSSRSDENSRASINQISPSFTIIEKLFQGSIERRITCQKCQHPKISHDSFLSLQVDIPIKHTSAAMPSRKSKSRAVAIPTCSVSECLEAFCGGTSVDGFCCENCGPNQTVSISETIDDPPIVFCVVFKRFFWTATEHSKIHTRISFPLEDFDLGPFLSHHSKKNFENTRVLYDLQSIVIHHGKGLTIGHYSTISYNDIEGKWFHYNDNKVTEISDEEVLETQSETPYLMFFRRKLTPIK